MVTLIQLGYPGQWVMIAGVAAALMLEIMMGKNGAEHLESVEPALGDVTQKNMLSLDIDNTRFSEYGNISLSDDIDSTYQRRSDLSFGDTSREAIDNSDVVESALLRGSSLFLPNHSQGVTTTSSALSSSFTLGEPDPINGTLSYDTPMDDSAYNLDQALARKQQHRSSMNKRAIDGAVRSTKNLYKRTFKNELAENEAREWWSAEATDFESDFRSYE